MHDGNGTPLAVGDVVMIPARVIQLSGGEDYCNVTVETLLGRRPDRKRETICGVNTGVLIKSNKLQADETGDVTVREPVTDGPGEFTGNVVSGATVPDVPPLPSDAAGPAPTGQAVEKPTEPA